MRALTSTLLAAQASLSVTPSVRCVRSRASVWEKRYVPGAPFAVPGGSAAQPCALAAGNGSVTLFSLRSGTLHRQDASGSGLTTNADLWATTDTLLAAANLAGTLAVVTAAPGSTALTVTLTGHGGVWGSAEAVSLTLSGGDTVVAIACCFAPDGRLMIVVGGSSRLYAVVRTAANTYAAAAAASDSYTNLRGVACAYTVAQGAGDVAVLAAATWIPSYSELGLSLFGDGGLRSAGSWGTHKDVLSVLSSAGGSAYGTTITAAGLTLADTLRATFVEAFSNPDAGVATSRNWLTSALSPAAASAGLVRDPQPLLPAESVALRCAYDPSADLLFFAHGGALYPTALPAGADLSARVLTAERLEAENHGTANVLLNNADGALSALAGDPESCGDRIALDFGYVTAAGAETSAAAPLWVTAVQLSSHAGTSYVELLCHDAWYLLAAWRPRRLYLWPQNVTSVLGVIQWLLHRAGIPLVVPGSPSAQLGRTPAWAIEPPTNGAQALHALLDTVPEVLAFTAQGAVLRLPLGGDSPVYSYTPASHPVLSSRVTTAAQALNHVLVFGRAVQAPAPPGKTVSTSQSLLAEAFDAPDALRIAGRPHVVTDMQLAVADAPARANLVLRKAQLVQDAGEFAAFPNAGLELWDPVALTESTAGWSASTRRVRALHTRYQPTAPDGLYTQSVGLMPA